MSDRIYEEFNNISFNESEFDQIEDSLTEIEIKKTKNKLRKQVYKTERKHLKMTASIALAAIICITFVTPAFAKAVGIYIPVIETIYEKIGYYKEFKDFSQYIGVSKEDKGYKFTIDKLVADDDTVLVAMRISKQGLNAKNEPSDNLREFMMTADLSGIRRGTMMGGSAEQRVLDENTSLVLLENETGPGKSLPKRFNMKLNIHSYFDGDMSVNFDLPVSREKIQSETIFKKNLGQSTVKDGLEVKLNEFKASPIGTSIKYSFKGELSESPLIDFYAYDDKGRVYAEISNRSDDSGYYISSINKIERDAKKLYIVPYIQLRNEKDVYNTDKIKSLDFYNKYYSIETIREFDFKEYGKINVYKTEKNDNRIRIYYSSKVEQNVLKTNNIINIWEVNKDNQDKRLWIRPSDLKIYKPDSNMPNNFCVEFDNVDANQNYEYSVGYYPIYKVVEGEPVEVELR